MFHMCVWCVLYLCVYILTQVCCLLCNHFDNSQLCYPAHTVVGSWFIRVIHLYMWELMPKYCCFVVCCLLSATRCVECLIGCIAYIFVQFNLTICLTTNIIFFVRIANVLNFACFIAVSIQIMIEFFSVFSICVQTMNGSVQDSLVLA